MGDQLLKDRQDAPIWNAIEANNFKQALKLVDKRLAKKHTEYLEALKVFIRSRSPLASEKAAVLLHLEGLAERKFVLKDQESIELYDEALGEVMPQQQEGWGRIIGELRWQCVKARPKDEDLSLKSFEACLGKGDLEHAKQISNSLEKSFPSSHAYPFWNIAAMFLYSISASYPENQRKLWGSLAFAQIGKLALATKDAADPRKLPLRSIQTPQELLLLHRITEANGNPVQRLEYLRDPSLGPDSLVAKGEWQLWRFKLKLLEEAYLWKELFNTTRELLKRGRTKDESGQLVETRMCDWLVWEGFIRSWRNLDGHEYKDAVVAEVQAHLDPACGIDKAWKRNASLAWVKSSFADSTPFYLGKGPDKVSGHDRIPILLQYLHQYGTATTAYNDLRPFVQQMKPEECRQLLAVLSSHKVFGDPGHSKYDLSQAREDSKSDYEGFKTASKLTEHINVYKLKYFITSRLPEGENEPTCNYCFEAQSQYCASCLKTLAHDAAKLYLCAVDGGRSEWNLLPTDRHPADDLAVLAAMCFIKLSKTGIESSDEPLTSVETSYILQAIALLEHAASHSQSNFQIWLLLTRLYIRLGCGSMAMRAYENLALKQIQLDTLSYSLFDRISSFHPHPFGHVLDDSTSFKTPIESLRKQQKLYRGARSHISHNSWLSFKHGSYNTVFELQEVSQTLSCSLSSVMSVIENRKISRLVPSSASEDSNNGGYDILPPNAESLETRYADTNDYATFPSFETTRGPSFEELCRVFPAPSDYRYRNDLATEKLIQLVDPSVAIAGANDAVASDIRSYIESNSNLPEMDDSEKYLTPAENLASTAYISLLLIVSESCNPELWQEPQFQAQLDSYNKDLCESLEGQIQLIENAKDLIPAFAKTLNLLYTAYQVGRTAFYSSKYLSSRGKEAHASQLEANKETLDLAKRLMQIVADRSVVVKKGLDEGGWIDKVLDSVLQVPGSEGETESVLGSLKDLMDAGRLEVWAGDVVESWRDSVVGLSYLKALAS
ncbi:uncharacterized protein BP5553_07760 [Venustampulla echinocandica]|uniref:Uncharacterized protein n=1 Tax=Venustampulla echinocandica TaxID=2656787 RepID=A0A370THF7_9HELO|nr:uncharacterized protein BP5553_07760 [Venustampulla echinocandica]RDL34632.1 hypothetical protein BP5553_07760 [Venustampulla echinocandica]